MANWELIAVNETVCIECKEVKICNIYKKEYICQCLKCKDFNPIYRVKRICGGCMPKWLKSRDMDNAE